MLSTRGAPAPWAEAHPVKPEQPVCCSWQRPAFVPFTTVVFAWGPFQQDDVGKRMPSDPDTGGQLSAERGTTFHPDSHQTAPHAAPGSKPAPGASGSRTSSFSSRVSIFRRFLHQGKHLRATHPLSNRVYCKVLVVFIFPSRNRHKGREGLDRLYKHSLTLATSKTY